MIASGSGYKRWEEVENIERNWGGISMGTARLYSSSSSSSLSMRPTPEQMEEERRAEVRELIEYPHQGYSFVSDFYAPKANDFLSVKPGSYSDIDEEDIKKFLPEGLAEGPLKEFEFSGRSTWMIRDVTKLLTGLIDSYEARAGLPQAKKRSSARFGEDIEVDGLTNRKEWENAVLRVLVRGTDLINVTPSDNPNKPAPVVVREGLDHTKILENCLDQIGKKEEFPDKILLTGDRGTGKSVALSQMVYYARKRDWICFYIPNGWDHVQNGAYVEPVTTSKGEVKYDNVFMSADALRGFYKAHSKQLKNIPITDKGALEKYASSIEKFGKEWQQMASLPGREKYDFLQMRALIEDENSFEGEDAKDQSILRNYSFVDGKKMETLEDLTLLGIALRDLSGSVVVDLVEELKKLDLPQHPVLLAVDQVNTWQTPSAYHYENKPVMPSDICVPYAFNFMSKKKVIIDDFNIKNGLCVGAVSFKHNEANKVNFIDAKNSIPLLIRVPTYNQVEFLSSILYYSAHGRIDKSHTLNELLALRTFTASNPRLLRQDATSFLLPITEDENLDESLLDPRDENNIDFSDVESKGFYFKLSEKDEKMFEDAAAGQNDK